MAGRPWLLVGAVAITILLLLELAAAPVASWRVRAALADCDIEHVELHLGARPHVSTLVTGRAPNVTLDLEGVTVGGLRVSDVSIHFDQVDVPRRRLAGLGGTIVTGPGTITASIDEDDLSSLLPRLLTRVEITPAGAFVVLLGAAVEVDVQPTPDGLAFRLPDTPTGAVNVELPAGLQVTSIEPRSGILAVDAELDARSTTGDLPC